LQPRVRYVDSITGRGVEFFRVARAHDLEGIVADLEGLYLSG
jgi:hypothetical protein